MGHIRGNEIAMILQEPMASLNPLLSIGRQIMEGVQLREGASKQQAKARAVELLSHVGIAGAEQKVDDYPYQFSGGHAATGDDRRRSSLQSQFVDCRRAHYSAGRHDRSPNIRTPNRCWRRFPLRIRGRTENVLL